MFYYATTDEYGVLQVGQVDSEYNDTVDEVALLAEDYSDTIYFEVELPIKFDPTHVAALSSLLDDGDPESEYVRALVEALIRLTPSASHAAHTGAAKAALKIGA